MASVLRAAELLEKVGAVPAAPAEVLFWTGAGISHDAPTCGPLGSELVERALFNLFEPGCLTRIRSYYRALDVDRRYPRLETVLDVVSRITASGALVDVLSDLREAAPNDLHAFFGRHLDAGGYQVTANFDDCIERTRATSTGTELTHFHGSFAADPSGERLGATLGRIQRGFPADLAERMRDALTVAETVVFAGYSGSDAFDVAPFLRSLAEARELVGRRVVWIRFAPDDSDLVALRKGDSPDKRVRDAFDLLTAAGARCFDLEGELLAVVSAFAAHWGWPTTSLSTAARTRATTWSGTIVPTDEQRQRASLELYAMMGIYPEVRRLFQVRPPTTPSELEIAAHATASEGRYREATTLWRAAIQGTSPTKRARREQHVASCRWREGRLLKAYRHLSEELDRADAAGVEGLPLWQLASITAHVFGHMRRRPLLRFFPTEARRRRFARYLPSTGIDGYRSHGPHIDALLAAARSRLEGGREHSREASEMFDEAEALNGMLNFRHAELRRRGTSRVATERPNSDEYLAQQVHFRALGLSADFARVPLLPGAAGYFRPRDVWRGLGEPDFALWHRLTLFAGYLLRHALRR